ncbi:hypothetical protein [Gemmata sp.]|uniref:hypothetical protein n=1 Tax=Gemmata sp. TaxID=1914242 RepID=UPI003F6F5766
MPEATDPAPTAPGRDDKAIADALLIMARIVDKLAARSDRPARAAAAPSAPAAPSDPESRITSIARSILAVTLTGLPRLLTRGLVGDGVPRDQEDRQAKLRELQEQRRTRAEDAQLRGRGGAAGAGGAVASMMAARFSAALGPLAIFAQTLQSTSSGMGVLQKSVSILAAVFAPLILPVAIALAAALIEFADKLDGELKPAFDQWTRYILNDALPAMRQFMDALIDIVKWVKGVVGYAKEKTDKAADVVIEKAGLDKITNPEVERMKLFEKQYREEAKRGVTEDTVRARMTDKAATNPFLKTDEEREKFVDWHVARFRNGSDQADVERRGERVAGLKDEIKKGLTEAAYLDRERSAGVPERLMGVRAQDYQAAKKSAFDGDPEVAALADRIKGGLTRAAYSEELKAKGLTGIGGTATATEKQRLNDRFDAASERAKAPPGGWGIFAAAVANAGGGMGAGAGAGGAAPKAGGAAFGRDALGDVVKSLRLSIGPKATMSGLESVGRNAQLAALNSDPLDRTLEQLQLSALERIEKTLSDRLPRGGPAPGTPVYSERK